jgi:GNAT superfamily N-acetyltransferase
VTLNVRIAHPGDYDHIAAVVDGWWGRPVDAGLPRLFLDHFWNTSRVAEDQHGLAGFLIAFLSPAQPEVAYIHFVGVRPDQRRSGLARRFYDEFALYAREHGAKNCGRSLLRATPRRSAFTTGWASTSATS